MPVCKIFATSACLILLGAVFASSVPISEFDCKSMLVQLREIYNYLLANGDLRAFHELVRKDGRVPSLRLRFGKRSDPDWRDTEVSDNVLKGNWVD